MNGRVQLWLNGSNNGTTIIKNFSPVGITIDNQLNIYTTDFLLGNVTKWNINGTLEEILLTNLSFPYLLNVDQNGSIYIADTSNYRILKFDQLTKNISIVAGGSPGGNESELSWPESVCVDKDGTIYIADTRNHRIMQWKEGEKSGRIIAGGNGGGSQSNQLYYPSDLHLDSQGNLYVVDNGNHRVQKFFIKQNLSKK